MIQILLLAMLSLPKVTINSPIPATLAGADLSVKLINDSNVPIIAVVTIWTVIERNGAKVGSMKINQDFYNDEPQIEAHSSGITSYAGILNSADTTKTPSIEVDGVLYADGRVVGANKFGIDKYIAAKRAFRDRVARDMLQFKGKEELVDKWLARYEEEIPVNSLQVSDWRFYRHQRGIARGWVMLLSGVATKETTDFWKYIDEIVKGTK